MTLIFISKLALVGVGVALIVALRRAVYRADPVVAVTARAKSYAVLSLIVWTGAMAAGRFMAYV